jgi:hypothetical protein
LARDPSIASAIQEILTEDQDLEAFYSSVGLDAVERFVLSLFLKGSRFDSQGK